jgi:hypothetical protein
MKYMVEFRLHPGSKNKALEFFEMRGPNRTPGVTFRGAWLGKTSDLAFVLVESPDDAHLAAAGHVWSEFGTYQAYPVLDIQQI